MITWRVVYGQYSDFRRLQLPWRKYAHIAGRKYEQKRIVAPRVAEQSFGISAQTAARFLIRRFALIADWALERSLRLARAAASNTLRQAALIVAGTPLLLKQRIQLLYKINNTHITSHNLPNVIMRRRHREHRHLVYPYIKSGGSGRWLL